MPRSQRHFHMLVALAIPVAVGGCTVLTLEEDRAMREQKAQGADPIAFVDSRWETRILPTLDERAIPLPQISDAVTDDLDAAGAAHGRQSGEGSPWTFTVKGEATVTGVDRSSQRGSLSLTMAGSEGATAAKMQIGPYVSGTAIRDALDFVDFNDFNDQLDYAAVGNALTARALADSNALLKAVTPGDRIAFLAVTNIRDSRDPIVLTPVRVQRQP